MPPSTFAGAVAPQVEQVVVGCLSDMTMLVRRWIECDGSACGGDMIYPTDLSAASGDAQFIRDEARKQGWRRYRRNGRMVDLCPTCVDSQAGQGSSL